MHRVAVAAWARVDDDGGLRRSLRHIWPDHLKEQDGDHICMPIPCGAPATQIVFNATGQQYRQITHFAYLGGAVTRTPNLPDEIDRRIRAGWIGFKRYMRKLYDRPKASLLPLKSPDGEIRGSRGSPIRVRDMDPLEGPLKQAPYNTPQDAASNSRSLVQASRRTNASSPTRRHPANRM